MESYWALGMEEAVELLEERAAAHRRTYDYFVKEGNTAGANAVYSLAKEADRCACMVRETLKSKLGGNGR